MPPLPKKKTPASKQGMRRQHIKIDAVAVSECPECHEMKPTHVACPNCGKYDGRQVINKD